MYIHICPYIHMHTHNIYRYRYTYSRYYVSVFKEERQAKK